VKIFRSLRLTYDRPAKFGTDDMCEDIISIDKARGSLEQFLAISQHNVFAHDIFGQNSEA
jgi:hypothetical protein